MCEPVWTVYILRCADGALYIGATGNLELRLAEHVAGTDPHAFTRSRRPVAVAWSAEFYTNDAACRCERQLKGWSRAKKEALIEDGPDAVHRVMRSAHRANKGAAP